MRYPHGRFRFRSWLRTNLPDAFGQLFPKGTSDCGNHEWYNSDNEVDRCYHCAVGVRPHRA